MHIAIEHTTTYRYLGDIQHTAQYLRLTPHNNTSQRSVDWRISAPGQLTPWRDVFGNACHTFVVERPTSEIVVSVKGRVETRELSGVLPGDVGDPPVGLFLRRTSLTETNADIKTFCGGFAGALATDRISGLHELMHGIRDHVEFDIEDTHSQGTAADAFSRGSGVCQDHAHLFIACCRLLRIPARYVGGYLYDGESDVPVGAGHAWAAAWVEGLGWVSFDVANRTSGTERYVGVAVGLDYNDAAPVRGVRSGGPQEEHMSVSVHVTTGDQ